MFSKYYSVMAILDWPFWAAARAAVE